MQFANIRSLKVETAKILALSVKKGPILITRRGRPIAVLKSLNADEAWKEFPQLWLRMRSAAKKAGFGPRDVEKLIAQVRKAA